VTPTSSPTTKTRAAIPQGVVVDERIEWDDHLPCAPDRTVIYATHQGPDEASTPGLPPECMQDAGMASDEVIGYLTDWGHAVELADHTSPTVLPPRRGDEYWGTDDRLLRSHALRRQREPRELKELRAGQGARARIEVFLDVATTHRGAATSGRCSRSRCRQRELHRSTPTTQPLHGLHGHGQHAQRRHPASTALDSLRYFVCSPRRRFRFDLADPWPASSKRRSPLSTFFARSTRTRPSQVKLIAEPWDVGPALPGRQLPVLGASGTQVPRPMRDIWRGEAHVGEFASRITGSAVLYGDDGRRRLPRSTSSPPRRLHAGDLSQLRQHKRQRRGQPRRHRRQTAPERGVEERPTIRRSCPRARQQRNHLTSCAEQGTPMLLGATSCVALTRNNNGCARPRSSLV